MMKYYNRRNIFVGLSILLAFIIFFVLYSYRNMNKAVIESKTVNATLQSLQALEDLMDDMQDMETGQRGYIISGNKDFLDPYYLALNKLAKDTAAVKSLIRLYPDREEIFTQLMKLVRQKKEIAETNVKIVDTNGKDAANQKVQSGIGNVVMDSIRSVITLLETEDRAVLQSSNLERQIAARATANLFIGLAVLFILGLSVVFWRLRKGMKLRDAYEQRISYLAGLTEKTSDAIFSTDADRIIKSWNNAAMEMYGYSSEEAIGKGVGALLKIGNSKGDFNNRLADLKSQGYNTGEYDAIKKNGEIIHIQASVSILRNDLKEIEGYVAVHRDITERKMSEQVLKNFNEELARQVEEKTVLINSILERISDGFYSLNENWCFTYINSYAAGIMRRTPGELIGKNLWTEYPDAMSYPIYQAYDKAFKNQEYGELDFYYEAFEKWLRVHIYPSPTGISVFFRDISAIRKAEAEMIRSNERFEMIGRTTNDAVWEWNLETGEMWGNETHQHLYGLKMSDPVPDEKEWQERIHPDDRAILIKRQEDALASDTNIFITEYRFKTEKEGYRNIYDRCYIVRNKKGEAIKILGSMMDVTKNKQAEEQLRKREAQLLASIENTPNVAVQWYNDKGEILFWNHASELIFGWGASEAMGKTPDRLILTPVDMTDFMNTLKEVKQTGRTIGPYEFTFRRRDNSKGFCIATVFSIPSIEGEPCFVCMDVDITESKKAAAALQESEEKYRSMIEQASDGIFILDDEGCYIDANPAGCSMVGYSRDEIVRMSAVDILPVGETPMNILKAKELKVGQTIIMERRLKKKSGEVFDTEVSYKMLSNGNNLAIARDITEKKKIEEAIRASEETRRLIMSSALDAIVCINMKGVITVWTPQAEKLFGWKEAEAIGMTLTETIIPEKYKKRHEKGFKHYLDTGVGPVLNRIIEIAALNKTGEEFPIELSIIPIKQGESELFCAFIRDITEKKKAEIELRLNEEKYRTLVEQAIDAIALYDANGVLLDVNTGSVNLLGYTKEELIGMSLKNILTDDEIKSNPVQYELLREGKSTIKQRRMRRKDGTIVETEVRSQQFPDGRFLSVIRDLTERIEAEKELAASYEDIRKLTGHIQNIREEERTGIAREIHDELGQQLTVLKMDVSWLRKKIGPTDEAVALKLNDLITMLDETVKTVRRISSALRPSLLDDLGLVAAMEWQLGEFEKRSGIATSFTNAGEDLHLPDLIKTALFRIFQESLTNIARHSNAARVTVAITIGNGKLIMSIADNGKGFDKQKVAEKKTLGILGMKERIAMIGGEYEIKSELGKGTEVLVQIPLKNSVN